MAVSPSQSPRRVNAAVVASVIGIAVVIALLVALVLAASSGKGGTAGRRQLFDAGPTKSLARNIVENGPIPYPDALNRDRPIYIQHFGSDLTHGWRAFGAYDPDRPSCLVEWSAARKLFVNRCDRSTYPPDGHGLEQYATRIEKDHLLVDLHRP
jgi:hypothetical protein